MVRDDDAQGETSVVAVDAPVIVEVPMGILMTTASAPCHDL